MKVFNTCLGEWIELDQETKTYFGFLCETMATYYCEVCGHEHEGEVADCDPEPEIKEAYE